MHFPIISIALLSLCSSLVAAQSGSKTCLQFDGKDDYVEISDHSSLNLTTDVSVEAWIKPASFGKKPSDNSIFCKLNWENGRDRGYALRCGGNGQLSFVIGASGGGGWKEAVSGAVLKTNNWYHVVGSFDGDTIRLYINGFQVAKKAYSGSIWSTSGKDARIGDLSYGGGRRFHGSIDEVRVWNKALNRDTIRTWMCRKLTTIHPNNKALVGYWQFNEGKGATAADLSGQNNKGKLKNSPLWSSSGAALGDTSVFKFTKPFELNMSSSYGDVFKISGFKGAPTSAHIYLIEGKSSIENVLNSTATVDTTHQWGVFISGGIKPTFNVNLNYGKNKRLSSSDECDLDLFGMNHYSDAFWSMKWGRVYGTSDSIALSSQTKGEFVTGDYNRKQGIITTTSDSFFCAGDTLRLISPGNDSFGFQWYRNGILIKGAQNRVLDVTQTGKYKVTSNRGVGCASTTRAIDISDKKKPTVSLSPVSGICQNIDSLILNTGTPKGGFYLGKGVKSDSILLPNLLSPGSHDIIYIYKDQYGCGGMDTTRVEIFSIPSVSIAKNPSVCNNHDTLNLDVGVPKGGVYTGIGINKNVFKVDSVSRKPGSYSFVYEYTDSNSCTESAIGKLDVLFAAPIFFQPIDTTCANGLPLNIKVVPSLGRYSGNGTKGSVFHPSLAGSGSHVIKFEFKNASGCISTDSQIAVVLSPPNTSLNLNDTLCTNADSIKLTGGIPLGGTYFGSGVSNDHFNPRKVNPGVHQVFYRYQDLNGCVDTALGSIHINDTTHLKVGNVQPICSNAQPLVVNFVSPPGGTYSGPGVFNDVFFTDSVSSGLKEITYRFSNTYGCKTNTKFFLEVYGAKDVKIKLPSSFCDNEDSFLIQDIKPSGGVISGDGVVGEYFFPSQLISGVYWVKYDLTTDNGCDFSDSAMIVIHQSPTVVFPSFSSICDNEDSFKLETASPDSSSRYYLNEKDVSWIVPSELGGGTYLLKFKAQYRNGCTDSMIQSLTINESPLKPTITRSGNLLISSSSVQNEWFDLSNQTSLGTEKIYEPDIDGKYYLVVSNDSSCSSVSDTIDFQFLSIGSPDHKAAKVYPNPAKETVEVSFNTPVESVRIYSFEGQLVLTQSGLNRTKMTLNISTLVPGPYILELQMTQGTHLYQKLLISH